MTNKKLYVGLPLLIWLHDVSGQTPATRKETLNLAHSLADEHTREAAIAGISKSDLGTLAIIRSLMETSPTGVDHHGLRVGLADVCGKLRSQECIPFLIKNISIERWHWREMNTWTKTETVVMERLPAVRALVAIGKEASLSIQSAYPNTSSREARLALLFTITQIDDPDAEGFLQSIKARLSIETRWVDTGLDRLSKKRQGRRP